MSKKRNRTPWDKIPKDYESGGAYTNTGEATIIADEYGFPKKPLQIFNRGNLACSNHAVFWIHDNDIKITLTRHRGVVKTLKMYRANVHGSEVIWEEAPFENICPDAIDAAISKSYDYHCRTPYYIKEVVKAEANKELEELEELEESEELDEFEEFFLDDEF